MGTKWLLSCKPRLILCVLIFLTSLDGLTCSMAVAHDLWINLSKHHVVTGDTVKIYLGWGHDYPFSDLLSVDRLKSLEIVTPSGKREVLKPEKCVSGTPITALETGTYLVSAIMKPGYYTKTVGGHTFKSKKESKDVISSVWYEKFAKAVFSSDTALGTAYKKVLGHTIEIVPVEDPTALKQNDTLHVKVLFRGKPLPKTFVYGSYLGFTGPHSYAYATRTNANGIAGIRIIAPGVWRLMVRYHEAPRNPNLCDIMKYTAFFTFGTK